MELLYHGTGFSRDAMIIGVDDNHWSQVGGIGVQGPAVLQGAGRITYYGACGKRTLTLLLQLLEQLMRFHMMFKMKLLVGT
jgi:hypothetical protein